MHPTKGSATTLIVCMITFKLIDIEKLRCMIDALKGAFKGDKEIKHMGAPY